MGGFAWVTLATNDSYSLGALVLANSLKQVGTKHQLAVLVTPGITSAMRDKLATVFDVVQEVNILDSRDETNLRLLKRPELGITFTKLHCWRLTQFEKCVFLDADTLVLQNSDELFEREELSAAPDVGWPDCFNSGVFVYRPSLETYDSLIQFALERGSFDGGDQGLLNLFFSDWAHKDINKHLPFIYNVCSTASYSYLPAFKQFGANAKIIHFIGSVKPWLQYFNTETKKVHPSGDATHVTEFLQRWWDIFCAFIHPQLSPAMQGQSQHRSNPVYVPPQYDPPVPNPENFENNWDPWEEYDLKVAQNPPVPVSFNTPDSQPVEFYQEPEVTFVPKESSYVPQPETVYRVLTPPPSEIHKEPEVSQIIQYTQHEHHTSKDSGHSSHSQNENYSNIDNQQPSDFLYVDRPSNLKDDFINNDQIPQSPNESDLRPEIPLLPCECETTTSVTSDISLTNTTAEDIVPQENAGLAGAFSQLTLGVARTAEQDALENVLRKQAWEVGSIDYLGKDSFENIWSKISQTLSAASAPQESQTPAPPAEPVVPSTPAPVVAPVPVPAVAPATPPVAAPSPAPTTPPVVAPATPPVAAPTPAPATPPVATPTPAPATPPVAAPTPAPITPPVAAPTPAPATPPVAVPTPAPATPPVAAPTPAPVVAPVPVPVAAPTPAPATPPVAAPASAPAAEAASAAPAPPAAKKAAQKATSKSPAKPGPAPPSAE